MMMVFNPNTDNSHKFSRNTARILTNVKTVLTGLLKVREKREFSLTKPSQAILDELMYELVVSEL